ELGQRRVEDGVAEAAAGEGAGGAVDLDRIDPAEAAEHVEIVAGAAADLEDTRVGGERDLAPDEILEDPAPGAVPPVEAVQFGHAVVHHAFHQPNTQYRLSAKVAKGVISTAGTSGHQVGPWKSGPVRIQVKAKFSAIPNDWTPKNFAWVRPPSLALPWPRKLQRLCRK